MAITFKLKCDRCGSEQSLSEDQVSLIHSVRLDSVHYNLCDDCYSVITNAMIEGMRDAADSM